MFEFASLLGITAANTDIIPVLPASSRLRRLFKIDVLKGFVDDETSLYIGNMDIKDEKGSGQFSPGLCLLGMPPVGKNVLIKGYLQSWKYFKNVEQDVRRQFQMQKQFVDFAKEHMRTVVDTRARRLWPNGRYTTEYVSVGIHVRRGDMVMNHNRYYGYTLPSRTYFTKAMEYFMSKYSRVIFIVISTSTYWVRSNIPIENNILIPSPGEVGNDFAVLLECNHVIISVGSFSWWAGWLNNGTVVYYADYPKPGSKLDSNIKKEDYFMPNWLGISD